MKTVLQIFLALFISAVSAQELTPKTTWRGVVLEKGTRTPLANVNVFILPHNIKATSDVKGAFSAIDVPAGPIQIVVNLTGYQRLDQKSVAVEGDQQNHRLYLEKVKYQGIFETTIVGQQEKRDLSQRTLTQKQFQNVPGAGGDPIKAVANLPGVNRSPGFSANVVIQGSEPTETGYLIDGHTVPLIFHFAGLSTIVFPEAIEQVDYLSAGYGPEYGRALGGLVGVRVRSPRRDRLRGLAFVDVINAGGLLEGGIDEKSGFLVSFRQSYIGEVLKAVIGKREDFNFTVAPRYTDFTALYERDLSDDVKFRVLGVGSLDAVEFLLKDPINDDPLLRGNFKNSTNFGRLIPQLEVNHGEGVKSHWSLGMGYTDFYVAISENKLSIRSASFTPRVELETPLTDFSKLYLGTDNDIALAKAEVLLPNDFMAGGVRNPLSSGNKLSVDVLRPVYQTAIYARDVFHWQDNPWTFSPGARIDYFSETQDIFVQPRASIFYDVDPSFRLKTSGGWYHQAPEPRETNAQVGNPNLQTPEAWQWTLGMDKDFRKGSNAGFSTSLGGFFRWFDHLAIQSNQWILKNGELKPEYFSSDGSGTAFGAETTLRYEFEPFDATFAYTLLRSRRSEPGHSDFPSQFDQTHNINVLAGVDFLKNWRLSTRMRYVTGNPYTPITSATYDADNNVFIPQRGLFYSKRLHPFFQLDVRVDKKWIYDTWILSMYLDIQNITNRKNTEELQYAYDYSKTTPLTGLPIIPTLGLKGEF